LPRMILERVEGDPNTKKIEKVHVKRCQWIDKKMKVSESSLLFEEFDTCIISIGHVPEKIEYEKEKENVVFAGDYINGATTVVEVMKWEMVCLLMIFVGLSFWKGSCKINH
jgi:hypothetical protein